MYLLDSEACHRQEILTANRLFKFTIKVKDWCLLSWRLFINLKLFINLENNGPGYNVRKRRLLEDRAVLPRAVAEEVSRYTHPQGKKIKVMLNRALGRQDYQKIEVFWSLSDKSLSQSVGCMGPAYATKNKQKCVNAFSVTSIMKVCWLNKMEVSMLRTQGAFKQ